MSERATRSRSNRLVELLGGDVVHVPRRPGEPDCTFARYFQDHLALGWKPTVSFEDGVTRMLVDIERWRDAPLWEPPDRIAEATKTWFHYLAIRAPENAGRAPDRYRHKVKSAEELRALIGPRPRAKRVIMCHGVFDVVHPGHIRHLLYGQEQGRHPGRQHHRRPTTSPREPIVRTCRRICARSTSAAFEVVDFV